MSRIHPVAILLLALSCASDVGDEGAGSLEGTSSPSESTSGSATSGPATSASTSDGDPFACVFPDSCLGAGGWSVQTEWLDAGDLCDIEDPTCCGAWESISLEMGDAAPLLECAFTSLRNGETGLRGFTHFEVLGPDPEDGLGFTSNQLWLFSNRQADLVRNVHGPGVDDPIRRYVGRVTLKPAGFFDGCITAVQTGDHCAVVQCMFNMFEPGLCEPTTVCLDDYPPDEVESYCG